MNFAQPCCLLFFTVSSSHTPNLSLSPPKRRQDSPAKTASLNMPITYTFVICRSDCWANAHVFARHYRTKEILAPCATHAWTMKAHTNRGDHTDTHTSAVPVVPVPLTQSYVFVLRDHLFHKSRAWNIHMPQPHHTGSVGAAHTWSSARGSRSSPKRKTDPSVAIYCLWVHWSGREMLVDSPSRGLSEFSAPSRIMLQLLTGERRAGNNYYCNKYTWNEGEHPSFNYGGTILHIWLAQMITALSFF